MSNPNPMTRVVTWCLAALVLNSGCAFKGVPKCVTRKMQISAGAACPGCQQVDCVCEVDGRCAGYQSTKWRFLDGCGTTPGDSNAPASDQSKQETPSPKPTDAGEDEAPLPPNDGAPPLPPTRPENDVPSLLPDEPEVQGDNPFPEQPGPGEDNVPPLIPPDRPAPPTARPGTDSPVEEPVPPEEAPSAPEPDLFPGDEPKSAPKAPPKPQRPPDDLFPEESETSPKKPATAPKESTDDLFKDDAPAAKPKRPAPPAVDDLFPAETPKSPAAGAAPAKNSGGKSKPGDGSDLLPNRSVPQGRPGGVSSREGASAPHNSSANSSRWTSRSAVGVPAVAAAEPVRAAQEDVRFLPSNGTISAQPKPATRTQSLASEAGESDDFGIDVP